MAKLRCSSQKVVLQMWGIINISKEKFYNQPFAFHILHFQLHKFSETKGKELWKTTITVWKRSLEFWKEVFQSEPVKKCFPTLDCSWDQARVHNERGKSRGEIHTHMYRPESDFTAKDQNVRGSPDFLNDPLAVSLCCQADKAGTIVLMKVDI